MPYQREVLVWYLSGAPFTIPAAAATYCNLTDAAYQAHYSTTDLFDPRNKFDRYGRFVTGYFGPTGLGDEENPGPAEPADCLAARGSAAVLTNVVEWPPDDV